jgi:hypothetical protein
MTTLTALLTLCRNHIGDTNIVAPVFGDAILSDYINRAIADLNAHFPRRMTYEITTEAGVHQYFIETVHQQIISVEYPARTEHGAGEDPPVYLQRLAYTNPDFWKSSAYYDFLPSNDAAALNPPRLIISANPATGETISLELTAEHNPLLASSDVTTIPDRFLHLVSLFVRWKTWENLASKEGMDPNPLKNIVSTHGLNAVRAEEAYRTALATAKAAFSESGAAPWKFPHHERIY